MKAISKNPGHAALRKGLFSFARHIYFITVCCAKRECFLKPEVAARAAAKTLHKLHVEKYVQLLAWVLMPDHMHLLLELDDSKALSASMARINSSVAKAVNHALGRHGAIWQGAYFDRGLRRHEDIDIAPRYILNNPIRAGLVDRIEAYAYWDVPHWQWPLLDLG
ncbi:MAG: REP-associated tyrosine transposase [Arenimonas sp.]